MNRHPIITCCIVTSMSAKKTSSCALEINCDCFQFCTDFFPALHSFPFILRYFIESENVGNTHLRVGPMYFLVAHVKDPKASYPQKKLSHCPCHMTPDVLF